MKKSYLSLSLLFCLLLAQVFVSVHDSQHTHDDLYKIVHTTHDDADTNHTSSEEDCLVYTLTQTLSHAATQADALWTSDAAREAFLFVVASDLFVSRSFSSYQSRAPPFSYA